MNQNKIKNIINLMTLLRIFGIVLLFFMNGIVQLIYLNFLFFTDFLDGYFARKYNATSQLGAVLDLVADKFLVIFLLILFGMRHQLSWIIIILIAGREIYSLIMRYYYYKKKTNFISASMVGKTKTFIQFIAFDALILNVPYYEIFFIIVIILSYYSILDYSIKGKKGKN